jgi:hypothetical protein
MQAMFVIATLVFMMLASIAWPAEYRWSLVRNGGKEAHNTRVDEMNDGRWTIGITYGHNKPLQEYWFRHRLGTKDFIPFVVPGAEDAQHLFLNGFGNNSTIVGTYVTDRLHAFLYRHGLRDHILIDVPGAVQTWPGAVNDKRQVGLGFFFVDDLDEDPSDWGAAVYDYATNRFIPVEVEVEGAAEVVVVISGLNNHLDMVGTVIAYDQHGRSEAFPWLRMDRVDYVGNLPLQPMAINDRGVIIGRTDAGDAVWETATGAFSIITHPKARPPQWQTELKAIANTGEIMATTTRQADGYIESWWLRRK